MAETDSDVVVIGAGIQGAGVAQAASAAGYRVIVLEQYDKPAQGTSSKSSKLIHGGLRYLETGQFSLVRECLQERARLLKNAPHLVRLVPFYIPVYQQSHYSALKIAAGLSLYTLFSFTGFRWVAQKQWASLQGLKRAGLKTVFQYYDAQTDDAALTQSVLNSATSMGARIRYGARFASAEMTRQGCTLTYQDAHHEIKTLRCSVIVNAAGPWVEQVVKRIVGQHRIQPQPAIELVQGTHIELPAPMPPMPSISSPTRSSMLQSGIFYLEAPQDQRAVFVMPWKGHLLMGTTETPYHGDPAGVAPRESEIDYLLRVYNHYFSPAFNRSDVVNAFAGLRVLPQGTGTAFTRPRDTLIVGNDAAQARFITLYGGKLTAYRSTAEQVMKALAPVLPPASGKVVDTRTLALPRVTSY